MNAFSKKAKRKMFWSALLPLATVLCAAAACSSPDIPLSTTPEASEPVTLEGKPVTVQSEPVALKYGSRFDSVVTLNVGDSAVESVWMDGKEISPDMYTVTETGLAFKPAFVNTLIGEKTMKAALKNGTVLSFQAISDLIFNCESNLSEEKENLRFNPANSSRDTVEEVMLDGKEWTHYTAPTGSTVLILSPVTFDFETGCRYEWTFDLKFGENISPSWWAPIFTGSYDLIYFRQESKGVLSANAKCYPAEGDVSASYTFLEKDGYYTVTVRFFAREKNGSPFQKIEMASWDGECDIYLSNMSLKKLNYIHTPVFTAEPIGDNVNAATLANGERKKILFSRALAEDSMNALCEAIDKAAGAEMHYERKADSLTVTNNSGHTVTFTDDLQVDLLSVEGYLYKNILIVDAPSYTEEDMYAYVMAHFTNSSEAAGKETMHMAVSHDGLNWIPLNGGSVVYESPISRIRDPYISRGRDGWFHLVGTTERKIFYARSRDLITWEDEHFLELSLGENFTDKCWAPEFVFDPEKNMYRLSWVDNVGNRDSGAMMHIAYTSNFYEVDHFEVAVLDNNTDWFDFTTLYHDGLYYVSYFKDAAINIAVSEHAAGPFRTISTRLPGSTYENGIKMTEAPITIKLIGENRFQSYWDYTLNPDMGWGVATSTDLVHFTAVNAQFTNYSSAVSGEACPFKDGIRHGSIVTVTKAEMQTLLDKYGMQDAPIVSFTGVEDGEKLTAGKHSISYSVEAEAGVETVEIWLDQTLVHTGDKGVATEEITLTQSTRITVVAYDKNGNRTVSYKDVTVA